MHLLWMKVGEETTMAFEHMLIYKNFYLRTLLLEEADF